MLLHNLKSRGKKKREKKRNEKGVGWWEGEGEKLEEERLHNKSVHGIAVALIFALNGKTLLDASNLGKEMNIN